MTEQAETSGLTPPPFDAPTLAQVAKIAGVSVTTASNVLTGTGRPSQQTAARVRRIARMLQYEANVDAQNLRAGNPLPIAAMVVDADTITGQGTDGLPPHTYWFRLLTGVWQGLADRGVAAVTVPHERLGLLRRIPVGVVLWVSTRVEPGLAEIAGNAPIIVARAPLPSDAERIKGFIHYDNAGSADLALGHLINHEARRIAMVSGSDVAWINQIIDRYRTLCERAGYAPRVINGTQARDAVAEGVSDAIADGYDACFDLVPWVGASLAGAARSGKRIPEDFQIVAHLEDQHSLPGLTTFSVVSPSAVDAAQATVDAALNLLSDPGNRQETVLKCRMVGGTTTRS